MQSKGAHFEIICRRATRGEITFHFLSSTRAAQHGLYTSTLLPTPMYLWSRPRSRYRMPSLVCDRGQVLRVLGWEYAIYRWCYALVPKGAERRLCVVSSPDPPRHAPSENWRGEKKEGGSGKRAYYFVQLRWNVSGAN